MEKELLQHCKNTIAKDNGCHDWNEYSKKIKYLPVYSLVWTQVAELYATEYNRSLTARLKACHEVSERELKLLREEIEHLRSCALNDTLEIGDLKRELERLKNPTKGEPPF